MTPKTQDENRAVYKLCIDIIGDLPISEIGEEQALTYVEALEKLPPNMNKMPASGGKSISEIIALNPALMAMRTINKSLERINSLFKFAISKPKYDLRYNPFSGQPGRKRRTAARTFSRSKNRCDSSVRLNTPKVDTRWPKTFGSPGWDY